MRQSAATAHADFDTYALRVKFSRGTGVIHINAEVSEAVKGFVR